MKKKFSIPGGVTDHIALVDIVTKIYAEIPDLFRDDIEITYVYDSFSGIWTGGRSFNTVKDQSDEYIRETICKFNDRGIAFRQIFTNFFINDFLEDAQCNKIMEILSENDGNAVTLASDLAFKILKYRYPKLKYSSSVTKGLLDEVSILEELQRGYDDVCIWNRFNNEKFIKSVPDYLVNNITMLSNQPCNPACNGVYTCALKANMSILQQYITIKEPVLVPYCPTPKIKTAEELLNRPWVLSHEDMDKILTWGVNKFKIGGRNGYLVSSELFKVFLYYLVKPEFYQDFTKEFESILSKTKNSYEYLSKR